jgi:cell division protein FtsL
MRAVVARIRTTALWPLALLLAIATVCGLLHVWVRLQLIAVGYEISHETQVRQELTELTQRLSLELRTRMDLGSIEKIARDKLQMVTPDPSQLRPIALPEDTH